MVFFIFWIILSFVIASAGSSRNIGFGWSLVCCLIFSPLIGGIITLLSDKKSKGSNIQYNSPTKYVDAIEEAKMMEFKGQKAEALDKYLDGYYLFQAGLKKKQIFPTAKSIETDNQFRVKIVELGGIIPDEALNVQELYKEATKLKQESVKEGNRNMLLFVIIIAGLAVIGVLISTLDIAEVKDINSYALHFEGAETEQIDDTLHTVIAIQNEGKNNIHNFKMSVEYLDSGGDVVVSQTKIFSTTLGPRGKQFYKFKIDNSDRRIVSARYLRGDNTPF